MLIFFMTVPMKSGRCSPPNQPVAVAVRGRPELHRLGSHAGVCITDAGKESGRPHGRRHTWPITFPGTTEVFVRNILPWQFWLIPRKGKLSSKLVPKSILKCYRLNSKFRQSMLTDLQVLGITDTVAFPDLDGLAAELKSQFS